MDIIVDKMTEYLLASSSKQSAEVVKTIADLLGSIVDQSVIKLSSNKSLNKADDT